MERSDPMIRVEIKYSDIAESIKNVDRGTTPYNWVRENFGAPTAWLGNSGWKYHSGTFTFYDDEQALMFLMRWNGKVVK